METTHRIDGKVSRQQRLSSVRSCARLIPSGVRRLCELRAKSYSSLAASQCLAADCGALFYLGFDCDVRRQTYPPASRNAQSCVSAQHPSASQPLTGQSGAPIEWLRSSASFGLFGGGQLSFAWPSPSPLSNPVDRLAMPATGQHDSPLSAVSQ